MYSQSNNRVWPGQDILQIFICWKLTILTRIFLSFVVRDFMCGYNFGTHALKQTVLVKKRESSNCRKKWRKAPFATIIPTKEGLSSYVPHWLVTNIVISWFWDDISIFGKVLLMLLPAGDLIHCHDKNVVENFQKEFWAIYFCCAKQTAIALLRAAKRRSWA